jgi:hypothetical protein
MFITDLTIIETLSIKKSKENELFFVELKNIPSELFDKKFKFYLQKFATQINCKQCANCCKTLNTSFTYQELEVIKNNTNKSIQNKIENDLYNDILNKRYICKKAPCLFLENNECTIYSNRPLACKDYPHLLQTDLKYRKKSILSNYSICPIVFNTLEALKEEFQCQKFQ